MAENIQNCSFPNPPFPVLGEPLEDVGGHKTSLALGLLGSGAAALFLCAHWSIALLGAAAAVVLSAMENEAFLLLVIFLMPLGWVLPVNMPGRNLPVTFRLLVIVGFFTGRLLRQQARLRDILRPTVSRASLLFLCLASLPPVLWKGELTPESVPALYALATYVGFFFVVVAWADTHGRLRKIVSVLFYSTIVTALFAFVQEAVDGFTSFWWYLNPPINLAAIWEGRAASFLGAANSLAGYLNLVLPFTLACYVLGQGKWKQLGGWTFGLGLLALLCTQSIGGLLAFLSVLVLAILCFIRSWKRRLVLLAILCASVFGAYLLRNIVSPVHTEEAVEFDMVTRLMLWSTAWNYFLHSPVLGVGFGNFLGLYGLDNTSFTPGQVEAHNIYLQFLAETGLVGFAAFFSLIVHSWRQAQSQFRSSTDFLGRALAFGVLGGLLSVLVHGSVDYFFQVSPQFGTLFWLLLALLVASDRLQPEVKNEPAPSEQL